MKSQTEFTETQKVDTLWPPALMALTLVVNWYVYFRQGFADIRYFYFSIGSVALLCAFLLSLRLYIVIDKNAINYRFFPFHFSWKKIMWGDVETAGIRKYKPISEYGGWGLRYGFKGKAYSVSGRIGLQLYLQNGKKILFGTAKPEELSDFLNAAGIPVKIKTWS